MTMPVFAGQKLVVVGGSSGMGRQAAADVVADATRACLKSGGWGVGYEMVSVRGLVL